MGVRAVLFEKVWGGDVLRQLLGLPPPYRIAKFSGVPP